MDGSGPSVVKGLRRLTAVVAPAVGRWMAQAGSAGRLPALRGKLTLDRHNADGPRPGRRGMAAAVAGNVPVSLYRRVLTTGGLLHYSYVSPYLSHLFAPVGHPQPAMQALAFAHPDDRAEFLEGLLASARDQTLHLYVFRMLASDGTIRWFETRGVPRRLPNGDTVWDGCSLDVTVRHDAEAALAAVASNVPGIIFRRVLRPDGTVVDEHTGGALRDVFGLKEGEYPSLDRSLAFVHPDDRAVAVAASEASARDLTMMNIEVRTLLPDGSIRWLLTRANPRRADGGGVIWDGVATDTTEWHDTDRELTANRWRLQALTANVPGLIFQRIHRSDGTVQYTLVGGSEASGTGLREWTYDSLEEALKFVHPDDYARTVAANLAATRDVKPMVNENRIVLSDGDVRWVVTRTVSRLLPDASVITEGVSLDVTARHEAEVRAAWLARYDQLTGLPNETLFEDLVRRDAPLIAAGGGKMAILVVGLDHFHEVNESRGHAAGDEVLKKLTDTLTAALGSEQIVARGAGGDEFLIRLRGASVEDISNRMHVILGLVGAGVSIGDDAVFLSTCIGASVYPDDGNDPVALMRYAGQALREAKSIGTGNCRFFTAALDIRVQERFSLHTRLRGAIETGEIVPRYQPQMDYATGRIMGAEALARWQHDGTVELPARFIPLAEETGLIVPLGRHMLERACADWVACFPGADGPNLSVNVAARQIADPGFLDTLRSVLAQSGLAAARLKLEITESALMVQDESAIDLMRSLRDLGVSLAIDDFGTGYSSLQYLARLPVDTLKVDQSFVRELTNGREAASIVQAIVDMAHRLDMATVAEGVETAEQETYLRAYRCDAGQGYLYARPMPIDAFVAFHRQGTR